MLIRWRGWFAALLVLLLAGGLVAGDITDAGLRHWWATHALTTDTVAGLLVLLLTVLVADQVVKLRQIGDRSRAVAAQVAIMLGQATRASQAVAAALRGSGDSDAAAEELRTYMIMLLVSAPVLIEAAVARNFLEQAQLLGGELARGLGVLGRPLTGRAGTPGAGTPDAGTPDAGTAGAGTPDAGTPDAGTAGAGFRRTGPVEPTETPEVRAARLDAATHALWTLAAPLLRPLNFEQRVASGTEQSGGPADNGPAS